MLTWSVIIDEYVNNQNVYIGVMEDDKKSLKEWYEKFTIICQLTTSLAYKKAYCATKWLLNQLI